jgi:glutathione S-transferase
MSDSSLQPLTVYGANQSFFTRKMTGYLDYKQLPWNLRRGVGMSADIRAAGWSGGIPALVTPDGEVIWDSTALILHFEHHHAQRSVLPDDPTQRFLAFVLEDFSDEWFYRPAVGSRWLYPENTAIGSWGLAQDATTEAPGDIAFADARGMVTAAMTASLYKLGTNAANIDSFMDESLKPWQVAFSAHLQQNEYLFGARPSLADFGFFGGNAAHFVNDPLVRQWTEESGPAVVKHTHRLTEPWHHEFGAWLPSGEVPDSLVSLLAEAGRHYLPWVAEATVAGQATVEFESGATADIATTNFLTEARGVMLARYVEARSDAIDEVLDAAGILAHYADHIGQATAIPDPVALPRPADNRPYPAGP